MKAFFSVKKLLSLGLALLLFLAPLPGAQAAAAPAESRAGSFVQESGTPESRIPEAPRPEEELQPPGTTPRPPYDGLPLFGEFPGDAEAQRISDEMLDNFLEMPPSMFLWTDDFFLDTQYRWEEDDYLEYTEAMRDSLSARAAEITAGCADDGDRIRAVALWMASNVGYDYDYFSHQSKPYPDIDPYTVLRKGYAVCSGYAKTCEYLLQCLGIPCVYVVAPDHAFNFAYDGERWVIFDSTWMSGSRYEYGTLSLVAPNERWYDVSYESMIRTQENHVLEELPYTVHSGKLLKYPKFAPNAVYEIGDEVKTIGDWTFSGNKNLTAAVFRGGLADIGSSAFAYCENLESVTVAGSAGSIGDYAFFDCSSLTNVDAPGGMTGVGESAFFGCGKLKGEVVLGNEANVGSFAFGNCSALTSVSVSNYAPNTACETVIGDSAFTNCSGLTSVMIPGSAKSLGEYAFCCCSNLMELTVPTGVTSVGDYAFLGCDALTDVYFGGTSAQWKAIETGEANDAWKSANVHFNGEIRITGVKADKTAAETGDTITWTATAKGGSGTLRYCFYVFKNGTVVQKGTYGTANKFSYVPTEAGSYTAKAFVKDAAGTGKSLMSAATAVTAGSGKGPAVWADKSSARAGDTITWTVSAAGGSEAPQYCFYVYKNGKTVQKGSYGNAKTFSFKATSAGTYTAKAFVKDASGTTALMSEATVVTAAAPLAVKSITADKASADVGDTITWTAAATGGSGALQYCFYVYKDGKIVYKGSYGSAKTLSYKTTAAGSYTAKVFVKDASGSVNKLSGETAVGAALTVSGIRADRTNALTGDTITWTAAAAGGSGTLQYCFYVYKNGTIVQKGSYGSAKTLSYKTTAVGSYTAKVFVKDASGSVSLMSAQTTVSAPLTVSSIKANVTSASIGDTITWTASATGGSGSLQYCFYIYKDGKTVQKGSYGSDSSVSYAATAAGSYSAKVFVKDGAAVVSLAGEALRVS